MLCTGTQILGSTFKQNRAYSSGEFAVEKRNVYFPSLNRLKKKEMIYVGIKLF